MCLVVAQPFGVDIAYNDPLLWQPRDPLSVVYADVTDAGFDDSDSEASDVDDQVVHTAQVR